MGVLACTSDFYFLKMKRDIYKFYLAAIFLIFCQLNLHAQYHIKGKIINIEGKVFLTALNHHGERDTLNVGCADNFDFQGNTTDVKACLLEFEKNKRLMIPIFMENEDYNVTADATKPFSYRVSGGGTFQKSYNDLFEERIRMNHQIDSMDQEYRKDYPDNPRFAHLQTTGFAHMMAEEYEKIEDNYIRENDNVVSVSLIYNRRNQLLREKKLSQKYNLLGEKARQTIEGQLLRPLAEEASQIVKGGIVPNLMMKSPDGKEINLYNIKSKVKILDFWASWCGPCRAENPNLKRIYAKYKSAGLEIIGVSFDNKGEAWIKAIQADGLPWVHMSDLQGWNSPATKQYKINSIPKTFILDQDNRVIAENLRGEELEKCVARELDVLAH